MEEEGTGVCPHQTIFTVVVPEERKLLTIAPLKVERQNRHPCSEFLFSNILFSPNFVLFSHLGAADLFPPLSDTSCPHALNPVLAAHKLTL